MPPLAIPAVCIARYANALVKMKVTKVVGYVYGKATCMACMRVDVVDVYE